MPVAHFRGYWLADVCQSDMSHMQVRPAINGAKNAQFPELVTDSSPGQLRLRIGAATENTAGARLSAYGGIDFK